MRANAPVTVLAVLVAVPALAQGQAGKQKSYKWSVEQLSRYEWNWDQPAYTLADRWRLMLKPAIEFGGNQFAIGVSGDFEYSSDINYEPSDEFPVLPIFRDNYKSRVARLDLAYLSIRPADWMQLQGGWGFVMPVNFTGMIWDKVLHPRGGAITFDAHNKKGQKVFGLTGLWAQNSHVFDAGDTTMWIGSVEGIFPIGTMAQFSLLGSFVKFTDFANPETGLQPQIQRQNAQVAGFLVGQYDIVDLVARFSSEGKVSTEIVADYAWNTAFNENNKGLWLALVLGSTETAHASFGYTFANIDTNTTLAAYDNADFFWGTGWEGNRFDLGIRTSKNSSFHAIYEVAKFVDSPDPAQRDVWAKRLRLEMRISEAK